jgi:hypothetical protein
MSYPIIPFGSTAVFTGMPNGYNNTYTISISGLVPPSPPSWAFYGDAIGDPAFQIQFGLEASNFGKLIYIQNSPDSMPFDGSATIADWFPQTGWTFTNIPPPSPTTTSNWALTIYNTQGQIITGFGPGYPPAASDPIALRNARYATANEAGAARFRRLVALGYV